MSYRLAHIKRAVKVGDDYTGESEDFFVDPQLITSIEPGGHAGECQVNIDLNGGLFFAKCLQPMGVVSDEVNAALAGIV